MRWGLFFARRAAVPSPRSYQVDQLNGQQSDDVPAPFCPLQLASDLSQHCQDHGAVSWLGSKRQLHRSCAGCASLETTAGTQTQPPAC